MKKKSFDLPFRQIHLDFHTSPHIKDVGKDFDAAEFAAIMKKAHVNSVTVFAKCHHGHLYYNTKRPERHPGLKPGLDLLAQQVDALHRQNIRAPIYISVQCDEYAADTYPEWIARQTDGKPVGAGPLDPGWQILDMSSPYQEYLADQTREVLRLFKPVDGIFFDMCWDQPSLNNHAVDAMLRNNLNPENEQDRAKNARNVVRAYMKRFFEMVKSTSKDATVYFNGRPYHNLDEDVTYQTQVEIEALPTGGWGYMYFPKNVRFARTFDRPYLGMTARFHKSWADFGGLKPQPALEFETAQMLAHGARCSIGDQLHPRGTLDPAAYDLIGKVYAKVQSIEPLVKDARNVAQIGLFQAPQQERPGSRVSGTDEGATRMLTQLQHQFDVVGPASDFDNYELLILPDSINIDDALRKRLSAYLKSGGKLLATGMSGIAPDFTKAQLPELAVKPQSISPFKTTYIRFAKELSQDIPLTDHVMYEPGVRVSTTGRAQVLAKVVEPYFDRSWRNFSSHFQTPPDKVTKYPAVVLNENVAYVSYPIFSAFALHGSPAYRLLIRNLLNLMIEPMVQITAPTSLEATVMREGPRTILHLLAYFPERRTEKLDLIEDVVPLYNVPVCIRAKKPPRQAKLAFSRQSIPVTYDAGHARFTVPEVHGYEVVVLE